MMVGGDLQEVEDLIKRILSRSRRKTESFIKAELSGMKSLTSSKDMEALYGH